METYNIPNGNQQNGYILQSDANGNADWVDPSTINPVIKRLDIKWNSYV